MKLTKAHKSLMVTRIMQDTPQVDYEAQAQVIIDQDMIDEAPSVLVPLLKNKDWRTYLITGHHYCPVGEPYYASKWGCSIAVYSGYAPSSRAECLLAEVVAEATVQEKTRQSLKVKLTHALAACTTSNAVLNLYPEFEKYLPEEPSKASRLLPVVQGLTDELKKLGWPK